ncbi:MgtC/SapB family protein [Amphibacillus sp. MSJ-3]|uniref:MgtC/SapB family protein n=1 Tax=Amphibacillus sp. MSJ-3 TaxID=2841505 RepID=UPI001C0F0716|nr:MgtC/SapB family protein [Amphibacillus sp. MSJ-3]MBU5594706.1 MgtC/SapB family protein [Amphibacillus sp. MSJ-3]
MTAIFDSEFIIMSTRLLLALVLSGIIGFEREINRHSAGFRTHILVGVSSCLMMLMSLYGFDRYFDTFPEVVRFDPARIPSYVISGIGFLGAGTIIVNGVTVKGLTTAASIWAVAGLGLVVGVGMIDIAILTTIIIFVSLVFLNNIERVFAKGGDRKNIEIAIKDASFVDEILSQFNSYDVVIKDIHFEKTEGNGMIIFAEILMDGNIVIEDIYCDLLKIDQVEQVKGI